MPEKWTKRSRPPSSGVMKPKPLSSLNHLTVPVAMYFPLLLSGRQVPRPRILNATTVSGPAVAWAFPTQSLAIVYRWPPRRGRPQRSAQRLRRLCDLLGIAGLRNPGQLQRVLLVARNHVHVKVKNGLPGRPAVRVQKVHAVGAEALHDSPGDGLGRHDHRLEILRLGVQQIR